MNLPRCEKYTLIKTFHTGGLENACACDNCGRAIVEVATISDTKGNVFNVGMDCAETLALSYFEITPAKEKFSARKQLISKIKKAKKSDNGEGQIEVLEYGKNEGFFSQGGICIYYVVNDSSVFFKNYPIEYKDVILSVIEIFK